MIRTLPFPAILLALAAGCASLPEDDDIWMPPDPPGGKADGIDVLTGSDIPSPLVDPNKTYLRNRTIANLARAGALDDFDEALARRVDGIIASLPADGRLHVAELVRIGESPFVDALFADERARLPHLWTMLEAPDGADVIIDLPEPAAFEVLDLSTPTVPLQLPPYLLIEDLPEDYQRTAQRIELVSDEDADPDTVAIADLTVVIGAPEAFTPAEIEDARAINALFYARATSSAAAVAQVPDPEDDESTFDLSIARFWQRSSLTYGESRHRSTSYNYASRWSVSFGATVDREAGVELPQGAHMILIRDQDRRELVLDSGLGSPNVEPGRYVLEIWQAGVRVASHWARLPALGQSRAFHDLIDWVDYQLITPAGAPLIRNIVEASIEDYGRTSRARFTYDLQPLPPSSSIDQDALRAVATPDGPTPGRYRFQHGGRTLVVDAYPGGVLRAELSGQALRLTPRGNREKYADNAFGAYRVLYDYDRRELIMYPSQGGGDQLRTAMTPDMRVEN